MVIAFMYTVFVGALWRESATHYVLKGPPEHFNIESSANVA